MNNYGGKSRSPVRPDASGIDRDCNPTQPSSTKLPPGLIMTPMRNPSTPRNGVENGSQHRQFVSYAAAATSPINNTASVTKTPPQPSVTRYDHHNQQRNTKSRSPVRGKDGFGVFDQPPKRYSTNHVNNDSRYRSRHDKTRSPVRDLDGPYTSTTPLSKDSYPFGSTPTGELSGQRGRNHSHSPPRGNTYQRQTNKSRSPVPSGRQYYHSGSSNLPADMTVLVTRTDLFDNGGLATTDLPSMANENEPELPSPMAHHGIQSNTPPKQQHLEQFYHHHHNQLPSNGYPGVVEYSWHRPPVTTGSTAPGRSDGDSELFEGTHSPHKRNGTPPPSIIVCRVPPCPLPNIASNPDYDDDLSVVHHNDDDASTDVMKQLLGAIAKNSVVDHNNKEDENFAGSLDDISKESVTHKGDGQALATPPTFSNPGILKYWNQRRRLFSKFDRGIQLDEEGWFSVTPEQIANHVAHRMVELVQWNNSNSKNDNINQKIIVLDAFCGCGGNAIAFAKLSQVEKVICVDLDREKLKRAANNAFIYDIPSDKIIFVECNALFVMQHCYRDGRFVLDEPLPTREAAMALMAAMPPSVPTEIYKSFHIGGIDLLPRTIDVVFLDPPWGGVDYAVFGKNGYDLRKNMKIQRPELTSSSHSTENDAGSGLNGFFDTFQTQPRNKQERKAQFNCRMDEVSSANGAELLAIAASASSLERQVIYDVPRNTSRISIGESALEAGYYGNVKVEEHYINGRLKTMTAYFGRDWRPTLIPLPGRTTDKVEDQSRLKNNDSQDEYGTDEKGHPMVVGERYERTRILDDSGLLREPILNRLNTPNLAIAPTETVFLPFLPDQTTK